jgi:uncharacterized protein (DUF58 family)
VIVPVPTARLAAAAAVLAIAVVALPTEPGFALLAANGLLLGAAALDWARAVRPETLRVDRDLPAIVALDGEAEVAWTVRNPAGRRVRVDLADDLVPSLRAHSRRARLHVPAGGSATARTRIRPARRGRFEPATVTVRVERSKDQTRPTPRRIFASFTVGPSHRPSIMAGSSCSRLRLASM